MARRPGMTTTKISVSAFVARAVESMRDFDLLDLLIANMAAVITSERDDILVVAPDLQERIVEI
jgi:hypothetical protein